MMTPLESPRTPFLVQNTVTNFSGSSRFQQSHSSCFTALAHAWESPPARESLGSFANATEWASPEEHSLLLSLRTSEQPVRNSPASLPAVNSSAFPVRSAFPSPLSAFRCWYFADHFIGLNTSVSGCPRCSSRTSRPGSSPTRIGEQQQRASSSPRFHRRAMQS